MGAFVALRRKAGKMVLHAWLNRQQASPLAVAYRDATRIGLLIPLHGYEDVLWAEDLHARLAKDGKACTVLCFSASPLAAPANTDFIVIGAEALRWNFIPKENAIKSFISINFDLLLNLCGDDSCIALDYAAIRTNAALRVGRYDPALARAYGLMVRGDFTDGKGLLKAIKHYLGKIQ